MKSIITVLLACFIINTLNAQSFDGVDVRGSLPNAIAKFKVKGYTLRKTNEQYAILDGFVGSKSVEVFIYITPITKVVSKIVVYLPKKDSWRALKNDYIDFVTLFKEKYGEWNNTYNEFTDPYYEGDGYEMSAVELDKMNFATIWLNNAGANYGVQITKFKQVMLTYENDANMDIMQNERKRLDKSSF